MGVPAYDLIHHGGPVRTKQTHPYTYDPIRHYKAGVGGTEEGAYDDRMEGWDRKKFQACIEKMQAENPHYGNLRGYSNRTWTRDFLRLYWDAPLLEVTEIVEHCNQATGYPCWYFGYVKVPDPNAKPPTRNGEDYESSYATTMDHRQEGNVFITRTGEKKCRK